MAEFIASNADIAARAHTDAMKWLIGASARNKTLPGVSKRPISPESTVLVIQPAPRAQTLPYLAIYYDIWCKPRV